MTGDRIQGYNAGVDAYMSKPFDPEELVAVVSNLMQRRAAQTPDTGDIPDIATMARQIEEIKAMLTQKGGIAKTPADINIDLTPREQSVLDLVFRRLDEQRNCQPSGYQRSQR